MKRLPITLRQAIRKGILRIFPMPNGLNNPNETPLLAIILRFILLFPRLALSLPKI